MSTVRDVSDHVVDIAERVADMADAAQGRGIRRGSMSVRWLTISAAGAGIYALATSDTVTGLVKDAKARASELPDDLLARVRQTTSPATTKSNGGSSSRSRTTSRRKSQSGSGTTRSRKTASAR